MEAMLEPITWSAMPPKMRLPFKMMRTTFIGWLIISVANMFVRKMIPDMIDRKLSKEEFEYYRKPHPTIASRKPVRVWPMEIPIDGKPKRVYEKVDAYSKWFSESDIPKLCFYAHPGTILRDEGVARIKDRLTNIKMVDIGKGIHFIQEDNPQLIGTELAEWYLTLSK